MTAQCIINISKKELGTKEYPFNSNRQKYGEWYGYNGVAWCCIFVCWVFNQAGFPLPYKTSSCSDLLSWYRANKPKSVYKTPKPGDIVIYTFGHTGIVEAVGDGTITVIEGNTSPGEEGSQSNGGMVCRRTRKTDVVKAYIRPDYEEGKRMDNTPRISEEAVEWAKKNGILKGNGGDLMLSSPCTREQMLVFLWRYHKKYGFS